MVRVTLTRVLMGVIGVLIGVAAILSPIYCSPTCTEAGDLYPLAVASGAILSSFLVGEALGLVPAILEILLGFTAALMGVPVSDTLETLALLGSAFLMFAAGLEVDLELLKQHALSSLLVGVVSFSAPMAAATLGVWALGYPLQEAALAGIGVSTTSVAVVYAILKARGLLARGPGQVVLASAMVADVVSILAFIAIAVETSAALIIYFASLALAPPLLSAILRRLPEQTHEAELRFIIAVIVIVALFSEVVGVHAVLYSFILGVAFREALHFRVGLPEKIGGLVFGFLSPIFFVTAGLHIGGVHLGALLVLDSIVLFTASFPLKIAVTHAALKKAVGVNDLRLSTVFAARLTVSTIIAYTGLLKGVLSGELAAAIMLTALAATTIAGVIAGWGVVEAGLEAEEEAVVSLE